MSKSAKNKKKKKAPATPAQRKPRKSAPMSSWDYVVLVMAIMHLLFFMAFVASFLNTSTQGGSSVFGTQNQPSAEQTAPRVETEQDLPAASPLATVLYGIYTLLTAGTLFLMRRRIPPSAFRISLYLLVPGLLMEIYLLVQLV